MASDEKRSALEDVLDTFTEYPDHDSACAGRIGLETLRQAREELRALRAENAAMREALEKYACHRATCTYFDPHHVAEERPCSCGLSALLRREDERG